MPPPDANRILIVEDDPGTAALQKRAVERAGYTVVATGSAEEALSEVQRSVFHLVLLDNRLSGGMSGIDFLASLSALAPNIPVIMVTGSESEGAVLQALRGGARDFIHKELNYLERLPQAIATVLQAARAQAEAAFPQGAVLMVGAAESPASGEKRQLERAGFRLLVAAGADEALRLLAEEDVALLIVHRESPGGDGILIYRRIKEAGHSAPAILLSDVSDEATVIEALRAGFQDFVAKTGDHLGALQDAAQRLTARARLETQVAESKARLAGIVNSALDPILLLDDRRRITTFNPAAEQLFETSASEAAGESIDRFIPGLEELLSAPRQPADEAAHFETRGVSRGGRASDLELSVSRMEAGGRGFISVIARDVTRRKELERLLLQKDKLESLGLLAGGIAHDFNNLLVGILGNASLAMETLGSGSPARTMLRDVVLASETAANLTRQLLAYAGKGRFVIEAVDLSDLVRHIAALLQTSIPKQAQLRLELAPDLPSIEADSTQMQQLIMNLVINGAEAIGEGGGTVLITTGTQHVDEAYIASALTPAQVSPGTYVILQVHDTGSGMTQETLDRIFDPFFTTKFTGRGLGLAAVLGIVRGHKGAIKVYSTPGQGTTFKVLFPATEHRVAKSAPEMPAEGSLVGETILVVDDEQIVRRTAKAMLERHGYSVVLAENGKEAVDLFKVLSDKIDLVLLDMTMPVMGGEETFRHLKTLRADVRVLLSSGYNEVEAIRRFTGKGLAGFIQKPYSALTLTEKIRSVLRDGHGSPKH